MKRIFFLLLLLSNTFLFSQTDEGAAMRAKAKDLLHKEHYAEALQQYQELLKQPVQDRSFFWDDFKSAQTCLQHLQRVPEIDELLAEVLTHVPGDWWLHWQAGNFIRNLPAYGILQGGKFYRGEHRSSGTWVNIQERNRRESLQHFDKARLLLQEQTASDSEKISFLLDYAAAFLERDGNALLDNNSGLWDLPGKAWRLQQLSDLQRLPDWDSADNNTNDILAAPVDREGKTIFYAIPASYAEALSDGERFRWLLNEAGKVNVNALQRAQLLLANVSYALYGVQTLRQRGFFPFTNNGETTKRGSSLLALETLSDEETIAQLANGIKRFQLPVDFCYIRIYQQLADTSEPYYRSIIYQNLANIFENRRHPERALQWWQRYADCNAEAAKEKIYQITGCLGSFLPVKAQVASKAMKVELRFRNAAQVHLKLYRLDLPGILQECKRRILKGDRTDLNYHFAHLGTWLLDKKDSPFIKEKLRDWQQPLEPLPNHRDRIITLEIPVPDAGAYWLVAELPGGQISRIPLLAEQYKLLMKPLQQEMLWQLLQTESGEPVPDCQVELFVWQQSWDSKSRKNILISQEIRKKTDSMGCLFIAEKDLPAKAHYGGQWLASAQVQGDKSVFVCASTQGYFYPVNADRKQPARAFVISDRPIYRPGQTLYYKAWLKQPDYVEEANPFAGTEARVWLRTPTGEQTPLSKNEKSEKALPELHFDSNGGLAGQYTIPDDAKLGVYRLGVGGSANGAGAYELAFRVEEYRKPEFEVILDLPSEVPELGETFAVNVQARYYFGTPLASGKAKVKVLRYDHRGNFWPLRPWDWLYGRGYWYFGEKYDWYPGWQNWGSSPPTLFWLPARTQAAPEVVAQLDLELDHNGEASLKIDSSLAKELYGDRDHRYEITAEVSDLSRRSVVGNGQVLVGRKAFILQSWTQGGYYKTGESITASAQLRALNGTPVSGKGTLQLFKIRYNEERLPEETQLQEWPVHTGADGLVTQQLSAAEQGQYRLAWTLSPDSNPQETVQTATLISIYGEAQAASDFRYNALELIPDKSEYAPGDTLRVRVNSEQEDSLVLLFIRPENGCCGRPQYIRLNGKSREITIPIIAADMPNFFLEAILVSHGEAHQVLRSIAVPPEKKTLNLQVLPEQSRLQPGEEARIKLQLKDLEGKPFQGNIVVTVYDKSLEYLSGGSNIAAIQAHFWNWKRHHYPILQSMRWYLNNSLREMEKQMFPIGLFDWENTLTDSQADGMSRQVMKAGSRSSSMLAAPANMAIREEKMQGLGSEAEDAEAPALAETYVRKYFADTAYWAANLTSAADGSATVVFPLPDSLTTWKVKAWAMGEQCQVGEAETELISSKKLLLRLIAPRFFVEKDEVVLSAAIHHELPDEVEVHTLLELEGDCLELLPSEQAKGQLTIAASGEALVNWRVKVVKSGEALIRMKALSAEASDAVEQRFPVKVHGMQQQQPFCDVIRPQQNIGKVKFQVPAEIRAGTAQLQVSWSPSLALAMLDALPYLLDYPYGCTEQTLNRFLPAVLTRMTLQKLGVSLQELEQKKAHLNPQELGDAKERTQQRFCIENQASPIFSKVEMDKIVNQGLADLAAMRCADGGWGWFSGWGEISLPHMTAQVVHGLLMAQKCEVKVPEYLLQSGVDWLLRYQQEELRKLQNPANKIPSKSHIDHLDALVFKVLCETEPPRYNAKMAEFLFRDKKLLSPYGKALLARGEWELLRHSGNGQVSASSNLAELIRNLRQFVEQDEENQTAWLNLGNGGYWWYWYGDENETQAIFLRLLVETGEGKSELASRLVKYLLNNRRHGTYWRSTRDTAAIIEAFSAYLAASGELQSDMQVEVWLDGQQLANTHYDRKNFFTASNRLLLTDNVLTPGEHQLEIRKTGEGSLYFNAYLEYFSVEDFLRKAGLEVRIEREVYRLHREDENIQVPDQHGQAANKQSEKYRREKLATGARINSGDLLEIELLVESKNDYEYLLIEDFKAAACEAVDNQSGYTGNPLGAYVEFRDDRVAFFVKMLPRGKHSIKYRLKAETPGKFSALPARICGFYAPELKGNSDEHKIEVSQP